MEVVLAKAAICMLLLKQELKGKRARPTKTRTSKATRDLFGARSSNGPEP